MARAWAWFFREPPVPLSAWRVVAWWELRRIPFNLLVGSYGVACLAIFFWAITSSGHLTPGEDAVEPMAILFAPFGVNALYTLGWLVEVPARMSNPYLTPSFGPVLLKVGLTLGVCLISVPALFWGGYRLLQIIGALH